MNRELKFRCWNGQIMYQMKALLIDENKYKQLKDNTDVVMQYTGLKDKNGKEIYEGDIDGSDPINKMIVVFHNGEYGLKYSIDDEYFMNCVQWNDIAIIGNIYENPELLNN